MVTMWQRLIHYNSIPNLVLKRLFYKYGKLIAKYPLLFTIVPLVVVVTSAVGLIYKEDRTQRDVNYLYAPTTSNYIEEQNRILSVWPMDPTNFIPFTVVNVTRTTQAILHVRDGIGGSKNMLSSHNVNEAIAFNQYIVNDLTVNTTLNKVSRYLGFQQLCLMSRGTCSYENEHITAIKTLNKFNAMDLLTYPTTKISKNYPSVFVAAGLGGTKVSKNGVLEFAKVVSLIYFVRHDHHYQSAALKWETAYSKYIDDYNRNESNRLNVLYTTSTGVSDGMEANAQAVKPRSAITVGVIIVFVIACSLRLKYDSERKHLSIDRVGSKPLLATAGVINAGLAIVSAQGLLMFIGFDYCVIVDMLPFLVLSIGVDDMFILTAAWRNTNPGESVEDRMALTMSDSAVSITITSLTNIASFAIGMITPIRAVQIFCVHMAVAIAMDYILQITFFAGFMAISGKWEAKGRNSICLYSKSSVEERLGTTSSIDLVNKFIESLYISLLMQLAAKIVVVLVFVLYLGFGLWGVFQLDQELSTERLILPSHHAAKFHVFRNKYLMPQGVQVEVMVQNVPDLSLGKNRAVMEEVVNSFEDLQFTMNKEATQFWMRDFIDSDAYSSQGNELRRWTSTLYKWTYSKKIEKAYSQALKWKNASQSQIEDGCDCQHTGVVDAFRLKIALKNFGSSYNQKLAVTSLRNIAKSHSKYNVTTYMGEYPYLDQYLIILPTTIKNIGLAILWMSIIAFVLTPNPVCILWIIVTILSIDVGVIGYMSWWGVSLDGVSMITIIMSIGFSVDFSAHITYGFTTAEGSSRARLTDTMKHMGLPVLQGGLSTLIGVSVMSTLDLFMVQTFFKTVFLVILFGLIHACIFLPIMLVMSYDFISCCRAKLFSRSELMSDSYGYHMANQN